MTQRIQLTLIGKPGCHLCDDARAVTDQVVAEFLRSASGIVVDIEELNILEDTELATKYHDEIPVLQINGKVHNYWRIDPERLRSALDELAKTN